MNTQAAIFLDRDGTLIEDVNYINDENLVRLLPGVVEALTILGSKGYLLYVVSNQSGVGRGLISDEQFLKVHQRLCKLLKQGTVEITEFGYCFHHPDDRCRCRKPETLLIEKFQTAGQSFDLKRSFTVGDSECDLLLADNLSAAGCLVLTGKGKATEKMLEEKGMLGRFYVFTDLKSMAAKIPSVK